MREGQKRDFARQLRGSLTDAKRRLWRHLRRRQIAGARFRRQYPIGIYIADFVCLERRLAIEVDGSQHHASTADLHRDACLRDNGFVVVRFWNNEVLVNIEGVCEVILGHLIDTHPHPGLPPQAEEGDKP